MKRILLILLLAAGWSALKAQTTYPVATDTFKLSSVGGSGTNKPVLKILNRFKDSTGYVLTNIGNGNYVAQAPKKYLDSLRRSGVNVFGYLNGVATLQFTDSVNANGEINTGSSLGGGLGIYDSKVGVDLRFNTLNPSDFNVVSNVIALDYANMQLASGSQPGILSASNFTAFNNKIDPSGSYANPSWITSLNWLKIVGTPTTLSGYGITDAQPLDADLTAIAALSPSNDDFIQRKAGAWTFRTVSQVKTDLGISNVANSLQVINALGTPSLTSDILSNRPSAGSVGRIFIATDQNKIYRDNGTIWVELGDGSGSGEANNGVNVGGGLAIFDTKVGVNLQFNSLNPSDFNIASNLISFDYVNAQQASGSQPGILSAANFTLFSGKENALTFSTGLTRTGNSITSNISTGVVGGQSIYGSTGTTSGLNIVATTGNGTTGADIAIKSGNNGALEIARFLANGNVGIGTSAPSYKMHIVGTDAIGIPLGNNAQRPTIAAGTAAFRFNTIDSALEVGYGSSWIKIMYTRQAVASDGADIIKGVGAYNTPDTISAGGPILDMLTPVGNVGTGEDDLFSTTIAGNRLDADGEKLEFKVAGTFFGSSSTKQVKMFFGGTQIYASSALTVASSTDWYIEGTGTRVGASAIKWTVRFYTNVTGAPAVDFVSITGMDLSADRILKVTGEAAGSGPATNDIVAETATVYWWPSRLPPP